MNKIILSTTFVLALVAQLGAQNNVILNINHKLGDDDFAMNQRAENNLDHDFNVTRLEYYISEITLVPDRGNEMLIEDVWILVDASEPTEVDLGNVDIEAIKGIKLHIGVDPTHNHLDPSSYQASHPLAPQLPSMHWGWTAGYRFVAYEGYGGTSLNQLFQLHGLGDNNYFTTEVELSANVENNVLRIDLDADYARALENISVNSGVIVHGDNLQAKQCLENFRDFVFSQSSITSSTLDFNEVNEFSLYPNPVDNGVTRVKLDLNEFNDQHDLTITSADGRQMQYLHSVINGQTLDLSQYSTGVYFVNLLKDGKTILTKRIMIR